jgi:hypothetical protein
MRRVETELGIWTYAYAMHAVSIHDVRQPQSLEAELYILPAPEVYSSYSSRASWRGHLSAELKNRSQSIRTYPTRHPSSARQCCVL